MPEEPSTTSRITERLRAAGCVYAEIEAGLLLDAFAGEELEQAVAQRVAGTPLEQLLGWAEFCGLRVLVEPGVFVPRRRTSLLVAKAVECDPHVVIDICCGSGAVGLALAHSVADIEVHAADIDAAAARCARRNLAPIGGHVYEGDLYSPLPQSIRGHADVIVANAPYVPTAAISSMPPEARDHEPRVALDGGPDGLALHRRIAAEAAEWIAPGGTLLIETSVRQADDTAAIVAALGFEPTVVHSDEFDATIVSARSDP
ncbi:MAG: putative protein N(5)-glutamine methyltransferase [Rhodococcus sp. (in: high G+C Gram-positive bacteria)]|uniref:putative protein N(5)-glutamine methyltransferase n=1 Tax=Rhodococcus sp. I2R TaxID=2855445 RepID=UPI001E41DF21|nr:putative protein N(5)-glutamine methyltransferase [Rhodococcus sp. I2R]MCC8927978.1 putative protein N(5)-glutamine methyltransferase [Rhodococcus sp. I2R]